MGSLRDLERHAGSLASDARSRFPYTAIEDQAILAAVTVDTLAQIARDLGRTVTAIKNRRHTLRRQLGLIVHDRAPVLVRRRSASAAAEKRRPPVAMPFARPAWFEERDIVAMATGRR